MSVCLSVPSLSWQTVHFTFIGKLDKWWRYLTLTYAASLRRRQENDRRVAPRPARPAQRWVS